MMNKKRLVLFLPILIVIVIGLLLMFGMQRDSRQLSLAKLNQPVPVFQVNALLTPQKILTNQQLPKEPFLINVWGSWCPTCEAEFPFLNQLKENGILIWGLNYRDHPTPAKQMLLQKGNPYQYVLEDSNGKLALALGVYGAPETYLIDQHGIIRFRYSGELTKKVWQDEFIPRYNSSILSL